VEDLKNISKDVQASVQNVQEACQRIAGSLYDARKIAEGRRTPPPPQGEPGMNKKGFVT
jgi:hypothetical protein